jgi:hypothetical protein
MHLILGYNVLQIFFEDNPKISPKKTLYTMWTGIAPDELYFPKRKLWKRVREIQGKNNRIS